MIAGAFSSTSGLADKVLTTNGDILYYNSGRQRLAKGDNDDVLTLKSGLPSWEAAAGGGWESLGSATLTGEADIMTVSSITAKKYLWILCHILGTGTIHPVLRFDNDSGSNYTYRFSTNGNSDSTAVNQTSCRFGGGTDAIAQWIWCFIVNHADHEKLTCSQYNLTTAAGSGTAPQRETTVGVWNETSNQISRIDVVNTQSGGFLADSTFVVFGRD